MVFALVAQIYSRGTELAKTWWGRVGMPFIYLMAGVSLLVVNTDSERNVVYHTTAALQELVRRKEE